MQSSKFSRSTRGETEGISATTEFLISLNDTSEAGRNNQHLLAL